MLLSSKASEDPRLLQLTYRERWLFLVAFDYCSEWNLATAPRRILRYLGVTAHVARRLAGVGLALADEDGSLTWVCDDIARFTPRRDRRDRPGTRPGGYTYLIQAGEDGDVKIGATRGNPAARLRELQTGSSLPLRLVKLLDGVELESQLHARYAEFRTHGEWFQAHILEDFE